MLCHAQTSFIKGEAMQPCMFCNFAQTHPQLVVHQTSSWSVFHVAARWPAGSLYLVPHRHGLLSEMSADDWHQAAPLLDAVPKMMKEIGGGERTYVLSFSEYNPHLHLVLVNKRAEHTEQYDGKRAVDLLHAMLEAGLPFDMAGAVEATAKYRQNLATYLKT